MKLNHHNFLQMSVATILFAGLSLAVTVNAPAQAAAPAQDAATSAPTAATDTAGTATARLKPVRKVAKPAGTETAGGSSSAVTTGSLAKISAPGAAGKTTGRCTRIAFEVNDYGKEGPTKDAQSLLDVHIAKWAAEKGIKKYTIGKKTVDCRLFLDFIVFDEHTCKAEAPVCW